MTLVFDHVVRAWSRCTLNRLPVKVGMQVYVKRDFPEDMVQEAGELDVEEAGAMIQQPSQA